MAVMSQLAPAGSALAATVAWGVSDFVRGYASRRANAFLLTTIAHVRGTALIVLLALLSRSPLPARHDLVCATAAALLHGVALAVFYRPHSLWHMGRAAAQS